MKFCIITFIPDVPKQVEISIEREKYLAELALNEGVEEEDEEIEGGMSQ